MNKMKIQFWLAAGIAVLSLAGNIFFLCRCCSKKTVIIDENDKEHAFTVLLKGKDRFWSFEEFSDDTFGCGWNYMNRQGNMFSFVVQKNGNSRLELNGNLYLDENADGIPDKRIEMNTKKKFLQKNGQWIETPEK